MIEEAAPTELSVVELTKQQQLNYDKAKIGLMSQKDSMFITTILFSLKHVFTDSVEKVKTDGLNVFINPLWFDSQTPRQRMSVLAEQAWHVAFRHMLRKGHREDKEWNQAADYVVGNILKENNYELVDGTLTNSDYSALSTEQIYEQIMLLKSKNQPTPPSGGGCGQDLAPPGQSPAGGQGQSPQQQQQQQEMIDQKVTDMISKAETQTRASGQNPGQIPGDIARELYELLNPILPWNVILQNHMEAYKKEDYSMTKPNRRYFPEFHLPSLYSEGMGEVAVAIDTSGSVTEEQFTGFLSEVASIKDMLKPSKMYVVDFDTRICSIAELEPDDDISSVEFHGGGGTNLTPVFKHFEQIKPEFLIVFSDLYCRAIPLEEEPPYPVYWICVDNLNGQVNFGTLIHYSTDDANKK